MLAEYRRSLKMPEAEEWLDLLVFRPAGYAVARTFALFPVTPNQVSVASMAAGIAAGWLFSRGLPDGLFWGGVAYAVSNVLDCSDGQLARIKGSGTDLGRIIDGAADYVSGIAVFIGIGAGLAARGRGEWWLVAAAGLSSALHAMLFDRYQSAFLASARGHAGQPERDAGRTRGAADLPPGGGGMASLALRRIYGAYSRMQNRLGVRDRAPRVQSDGVRPEGAILIRWWSFLGPTTNRTILIGCALAGDVVPYLWTVLAAGNAWTAVVAALQYRADRSAVRRDPAVARTGE